MSAKLLHSFVWDFTGRIGGQIVTFIIGIILARLLSPAEFGLIGMAMVFIAMSEIFTNLGLSSALIQRTNPSEAHYSSSFFLNLIASVLLAILFAGLAPLIAIFFKSPEITNIIRVLALTLIISGFTVVQEARLRKLMRFNVLTKAKLISSVLGGIVGIFLALLGYSVWSLVFQTLFSRMILTAYYWLYSDWKPKWILQLQAIRDLWAYSFNLFISGIINTTYSQLDSIIIARIFSPVDLGLYSRAKSLNGFVIKYSSESIGSITFPAMANMKENHKGLLEFGLKTETLIAFVSFGLLGWLYVSAESLIMALLGPKWEPSIAIFKLLCLSGFVYPISAATLSMLKAAGYSKEFLKVEVWKKIVGLSGLGIGLMFGLEGFLISLIITGIINIWLNMHYTGKALGITVKHQVRPLLIYLVLATSSVIVVSFMTIDLGSNLINFFLTTIAFAIAYLFSNMLINTTGLIIFKQQIYALLKRYKLISI